MEPGDLHEDPAGERLARAVAGAGVSVRDSATGQWAIVAGHRGILRVATASLAAVNGLEGVSVYTLFDGQVVDAGEVVARAKVTPLVIAESVVREVEERFRQAGGCVAVRPFEAWAVGAVAPGSLTPRVRARFEAVLREKLDWFGAPAGGVSPIRMPRPRRSVKAVEDSIAAGARIVVVAGANALDPLDPVVHGASSESAAASCGPACRPIRGASCGSRAWGRSRPRHAGVRHVLPGDPLRLAAPAPPGGGDRRPEDLAAYGHGGLLGREMAFRFPPYRAGRDRGTLPE